MHIIDRRLNPSGKSLNNRQRFVRRYKEQIRDAVAEAMKDQKIKDSSGISISIKGKKGTEEPRIYHDPNIGERDRVLPGNKIYEEGTRIKRPESGSGSGGGGSDAGEGEATDPFQFALSQEEYLKILFEDWELPDLVKKQISETPEVERHLAGHINYGNPSRFNIKETMKKSLGRRIAFGGRPRPEELTLLEEAIQALKDDITATHKESMSLEEIESRQDELDAFREQHAALLARRKRILFLDPLDVRYHNVVETPRLTTSAVMFCLMDVSGSMTEEMKDLAKRSYKLLYLFLERRYKNVEIVFIRHTEKAKEVDEETFFNSTETGGTLVSSAYEEMLAIAKKRYPADKWNMFGVQAGDGDNTSGDGPKCLKLLKEVLAISQFFAYVQVKANGNSKTDLWKTYEQSLSTLKKFVMRQVTKRAEIYPVFAELFTKKSSAPAKAAAFTPS